MKEATGQIRVIIEGLKPEINGGRFPIKRVIGERVVVEADIFADGHDSISALLLYRKEDDPEWSETPMEPLVNDRWRGSFVVAELGRYRYTVLAWVDQFKSWRRDLTKKFQAGQEISIELVIGAQLITEASQHAP
ncbi:MAG: maltotransferase domain-containing protein, partial [Dehalococcoidia bacterium]